MIQAEETPSPNFDDRPARTPIDILLLHYTGMRTGAAALERLRDPNAKVSAHYLVEEDGRLFRLVDEEKRAWHAGVAFWRGEEDINARSIGVEIVNPGHEWGYRPFPEAQVKTVVELCRDVVARHAVPRERVLGHSDVAPERKEDPGELFPWERLAFEGLALPPYGGPGAPNMPREKALSILSAFGYRIDAKGPAAAILAFQRRFAPAALGRGLDPLTKGALSALAQAGLV